MLTVSIHGPFNLGNSSNPVTNLPWPAYKHIQAQVVDKLENVRVIR